ncbi:MAG: NUDIX hydrolase [Sulfurimonas sp. RIFOXYD12_FULL_33_39]|uniref:NUDIX domain-containing protein n=1 Tax=unclassified Sulfurimonas TaxID=2623549 RepID=UPI0008D7518D|nr:MULTISPECIES: NUDIX hydrolase [unclassified Sulfurimonas]OHE07513.1 MAG: NUDIX hydrolase [Sulfurimonas sp. RIFCSPLOWO2_12_FULL_34_6]OHE10437.1 MAG: NUDIX hydrolase [Sulfurimonas sp. RIFOXYD12_FULL_33_39]OHE14896.1 MAG: NUDIX hydrolase [Sulfurimonas sp. RIFOXYD2_FULL_34_21]DAB27396.1 MAG TPA: NUDIX hydrolase [Sulfurimonas sp. UBA10385]
MYKIKSIQILENPKFIKPILINYSEFGVEKKWEAVVTHDSVAVLLWHSQKNAFVLVKQLRATVLNKNKNNGMMYELCAGIVDKDKSNIEIAKEEILEECGYDVPLENLQKIGSFYTSVGISGTHQTIYYASCDESMRVSEGGGLHDEEIEVVYIPVNEAKSFMFDESYQKTTGVLMSFYWFFDNVMKIQ